MEPGGDGGSRHGLQPGPLQATSCGARLARLVTEVLAPAPTVAVLVLLVAWQSTPTAAEAVRWGALAAIFVSVVPFLYVVRGVRRGGLSDHHVGVRQQRPVPLLVGVASMLVGLVLLVLLDAPRDLIALVAVVAAGLGLSLLVTLVWKLSIHAAVVSGAVTILLFVFGPPLLVVAPLVPLVCWARVAVHDHTPAQTLAGAVLGATVAAVVFSALR
jgi:membrane-associated phospholipid phosphatase